MLLACGEEPGSKNIKYSFDDVDIASGVDGLDGLRAQSEVDEEEDNLHCSLTDRAAYAVWADRCPVMCVVSLL